MNNHTEGEGHREQGDRDKEKNERECSEGRIKRKTKGQREIWIIVCGEGIKEIDGHRRERVMVLI